MASKDALQHDSDVRTLHASNAALQEQNIKLQRDYAALEEQVTALKHELLGLGATVGPGIGARVIVAQSNVASASAPFPSPCPSAAMTNMNSCTAPLPSTATSPPPATTELASNHRSEAPFAPTTAPPRQLQLPLLRAAPCHGLSRTQAERYSRHLVLPAFGVAAQERLCCGSVLVVGCGGLGSPVAMYLAAAGVGRLGLVDHDTVDVSNLHRQILHATSRVGLHKAVSGRITCAAINPTIQIDTHTHGFTPATALELTDQYDVVVDASDNPATRYLVSDACVISGKPLVSAAAVGTDGQLTVYNYKQDGPCYRCLFPESPSAENCSRCGEAGVLGVVPGIMGCLQALEAIKILSGVGDVSSKKLTLFDALSGRFTSVRLRNRNPACVACGTCPSITRANMPTYDYVLFTGQQPDDGPPEDLQLIDPRIRLEPRQVAALLVAAEVDSSHGPMGTAAAAVGDCTGCGASKAPGAQGHLGQQEHFQMQQQQEKMLIEQKQGLERRIDEAAGSPHEHGEIPQGEPGTKEGGDEKRCHCQRTFFLDVRPKVQYDVMALRGVVHVPYERLEERLPELLKLLGVQDATLASVSGHEASSGCVPSAGVGVNVIAPAVAFRARGFEGDDGERSSRSVGGGERGDDRQSSSNGVCDSNKGAAAVVLRSEEGCAYPRVVVLCRRGNNSQRVVARLTALGVVGATDMRGGYEAWAREVDQEMPVL